MSNFEERLLLELKSVVEAAASHGHRSSGGAAGRAWSCRRASGVLAMAAIAAFFLSSGAQTAYAVTKNSRTISVEVDSLTDAPGLQSALQAAA